MSPQFRDARPAGCRALGEYFHFLGWSRPWHDKVGVTVDEAWQHNSALGINFLRPSRSGEILHPVRWTHVPDDASLDQDGAVLDDVELAQSEPSAGPALAPDGDDLRRAADQQATGFGHLLEDARGLSEQTYLRKTTSPSSPTLLPAEPVAGSPRTCIRTICGPGFRLKS